MNPKTAPTPGTPSADADLHEQARPNHGVPSQDPDPEAQVLLNPQEAAREEQSVYTGGGLVVGMATGVAIGMAVAGPVGGVVGASVGAVAGVLGGAAVGTSSSEDPPKPVKEEVPAPDSVPPRQVDISRPASS